MAISFSKLKTGAWGIRGTGITIGVPLVVTKRDGSTTRAVASRILWTGEDGTQLAAVAETPHSASTHRSTRRGCSCTDSCCARGCRCEAQCNCQGGPIYDC